MPSLLSSLLPDTVSVTRVIALAKVAVRQTPRLLPTTLLPDIQSRARLLLAGSRPTRQVGLLSQAEERSALLPIHSLSRPSAPSRPPPLVGLAYRATSKDSCIMYVVARAIVGRRFSRTAKPPRAGPGLEWEVHMGSFEGNERKLRDLDRMGSECNDRSLVQAALTWIN
ncbi:hypothetical protein L210DRAFT_3648726 [Boletus edulis BED1]|uniref:Uncharacterized protein n=1 Tax=Boletus edulis BED1 TaxID=1328754 RepID=A0AAD4BNF0_BOLED|nr:hypothetical protein L210DRAFT_3648726 [Boletus edulis BED1]